MSIKKQIYDATFRYFMAHPKQLIYISGKVSGLDPMDVFLKFLESEQKLIAHGYEVFNPTAWLTPETDWQQAMKLCIAILPMCDGIYLLPDWHQSRGAKIERDTALMLGMPVIEI